MERDAAADEAAVLPEQVQGNKKTHLVFMTTVLADNWIASDQTGAFPRRPQLYQGRAHQKQAQRRTVAGISSCLQMVRGAWREAAATQNGQQDVKRGGGIY